ncbi:MAG: hypothetical protein Q8P53_03640 [Candidatus Shapirobacteria bacterium]|nr:hypothetical protein [Candidatus Shapirobacteria bacterium]
MTDNLYFLFLDEIYTPNLNEFRNIIKDEIFNKIKHWHFGIAGTIFPASGVYDIYDKSRKIKNKYYSKQSNLIFHYVDTLNKKDAFSDLAKDPEKYCKYTLSLNSLVENSDFKYISSFVDKHELIKKYGVFDTNKKLVKIQKIGSNLFPKSPFLNYNLYLLCLKNIVVEFYNFISSRNISARGIIVAEARGEREDSELRQAFQKMYYYGVSSIQPTQLRRVILDLFIVPKTQNYVGTQITDMLIYPTYDTFVPNHNSRKDHFITFNSNLKRKFLNSGVKITP